MKRFRFKLETLLKVTRSKKEDAEVKFAEASRKLEADKESSASFCRRCSRADKITTD